MHSKDFPLLALNSCCDLGHRVYAENYLTTVFLTPPPPQLTWWWMAFKQNILYSGTNTGIKNIGPLHLLRRHAYVHCHDSLSKIMGYGLTPFPASASAHFKEKSGNLLVYFTTSMYFIFW